MTAGQLTAREFVEALRRYGVRQVTGVPCGHLAGPWSLLEREGALIAAADEGAALSIAAGAELAGTTVAVFCQNSGFGNLINPLTSLVLPYRIPVLVVMTLRGWPDPGTDEPQHAVMGQGTEKMLAALDVPYGVLGHGNDDPAEDLEALLAAAHTARAAGRPFFLLVPRGSLGKDPDTLGPAAVAAGQLTRPDLVSRLFSLLDDELVVTTTGYLSRQAHHEADRDGTFYMQGSMGHAAAIALGVAVSRPRRRVVVLDGDGAFLMHLGTGSTITASAAENLVHVVVDNGCYESTGCQLSTAGTLDWDALGRGLGYRLVQVCRTAADLAGRLAEALRSPGPVLFVAQVVPTPDQVHPRATAETTPEEIAGRFRHEATQRSGSALIAR